MYMDNNTITSADAKAPLLDASVCKLKIAGDMFSRFDLNYMKTNPEKFHFILFAKENNTILRTLCSYVSR